MSDTPKPPVVMTSSRPYMIRALYEWIVDNGFTPHLIVNAHAFGAEVPQEHVSEDGKIILNVAPRAVADLQLGNKKIAFNARFSGVPTNVSVPCHGVMGIYARENGQGMMFDSDNSPDPEPNDDGEKGTTPSGKPALRVVK